MNGLTGKLLNGFLLQLQFLTRIPVPVKIEYDEITSSRGVIYSPIVGFIIGLIIGGVYIIFHLLGKPVLGILAATILEILITGGLHLDGLADTFDGIFSNKSKSKILEIMKDSRIGTNGTLSLILLILSKLGMLLLIKEQFITEALFIMPAVSRMNIVWCAGISSYAREDRGLGSAVVENTGPKEIIITTGITIVLSVIFLKVLTLAVIPCAILFAVLFTQYVKKKIGGVTGDIIGAVIELTEIVFLFTLLLLDGYIF